MSRIPDREPLRDVIYDWNLVDSYHQLSRKEFRLLDETLRDGLQSASVVSPAPREKLELLRLMNAVGIDTANLGLPGSGERNKQDCILLARAIVDEKMRVKPAATARTLLDDVRPIVEMSQAAGVPVEVMSFIGSSPIRMLAEEWDLPFMLERSRSAITMARREGLPVTFVTEDTTRSRPDILYKLFNNAIDAGAQRLCICDTVGHVTPDGIRVLLRFVSDLIKGMGVDVGLDWHGHNDRGLALSNSIWALQWGADRVHGCALGVGERTGNTSIERLIMNLALLGSFGENRDLSRLLEYCECASRVLRYPIPGNYPLAGRDAFRTQAGVHASAIAKARQKGDDFLADRVYSGVPAGMFGRHQEIVIGPMSGNSNVIQYLAEHGRSATEKGVSAILARAKASDHILAEAEVLELLREED